MKWRGACRLPTSAPAGAVARSRPRTAQTSTQSALCPTGRESVSGPRCPAPLCPTARVAPGASWPASSEGGAGAACEWRAPPCSTWATAQQLQPRADAEPTGFQQRDSGHSPIKCCLRYVPTRADFGLRAGNRIEPREEIRISTLATKNYPNIWFRNPCGFVWIPTRLCPSG